MGLSQTVWGFLRKNFKTVFDTLSPPPRQKVIFIFGVSPPPPQTWSRPQKQFFPFILENIVFIEKVV